MDKIRKSVATKKPVRDSSTSKRSVGEESGDRKVTPQDKTIIAASRPKVKADKDNTRSRKASKETPNKTKSEGTTKIKKAEIVKARAEKIELKNARGVSEGKNEKRGEEKRELMKEEEKRQRRAGAAKAQQNAEAKPEMTTKKRRDRTRTRTLSPTEIKQLIPSKMAAGDFGRGEIANPVGNHGDVRKIESVGCEDRHGFHSTIFRSDSSSDIEAGGGVDRVIQGNEVEDYEDDFEDYESDFEDDEITAEPNEPEPARDSDPTQPEVHEESAQENMAILEVKDASEQWKLDYRKREIQEIKESIAKENTGLVERKSSVLFSSRSPVPVESHPQMDERIVDFSLASRREKHRKEVAAARKRGQELLSMITLDAVTYNVLEIPPIPYEDFMKTYGRSNTKQVHVQTNEDNLEDEIQTDEIVMCTKWTQNPPEYLGSTKTGSSSSFVLTREERLGVGGDHVCQEEDAEEKIVPTRSDNLLNFLSWAGQMMLAVLERKIGSFLHLESLPNHSKDTAFGDAYARLNVRDISFLKDRSVTHICILPRSSTKLLSVHALKNKQFQRCMVCVWSFRELSRPLKILIASNRITAISFGPNQGDLVFAGLSDGSVCLWDLREPLAYHHQSAISGTDWTLQSPTYVTLGSLDATDNLDPIVSLALLKSADLGDDFADFTPIQICSLDRSGKVTIWSVIQIDISHRNAPSEDLGLAHWGRVKLVKSSSFCVFETLREEIPGLYITCNDLLINEAEDDGVYIANSFGSVQHCSIYGSPLKPNFYVPTNQNTLVETTCLELCPFNGNYFLAGCGDGSIRLHSRHQDIPLITLNSSEMEDDKPAAAVVSLIWMKTRPCVFFALDAKSRIHVWDLGVSDMYPEMSLLLSEKKITCMKLLASFEPGQVPFLILGTEGGKIGIHKLKKHYGCKSVDDMNKEMKMFLKYVSIL